jgi:hypothetical protein
VSTIIPVPIPALPPLPGSVQDSDLVIVYRPSTNLTYGVTAAQFDTDILTRSNAWTGPNTFAGTSTFNGATTFNGAVTFAGGLPISPIAASSLYGNPTGAAAVPSAISLGATLAFSGASLLTAALTGDVTATANSFATTVSAIRGTTVTGTTGSGNVVFQTSPSIAAPTITGHPTVEGVTSTGATGTGKFVFDGSPTLTGTPLAPTAAGGTNTTQIATTAFVAGATATAITATTPTNHGVLLGTGTQAAGVTAVGSTGTVLSGNTGADPTFQTANIAAGVTLPSYFATISTQSGTTYTLASTDSGTVVQFTSGSAITVTLPNSLAVGTCIGILQVGAGQITFSAAAGAAFHNAHSFTKTFGQYAGVSLTVYSNSGGTSAIYALVGDGA